jgi:hypothetical protein
MGNRQLAIGKERLAKNRKSKRQLSRKLPFAFSIFLAKCEGD